ncbi:uncharacterized protein LOC141684205 isoform X2 [Apium graveolens]|uniref:uncharacterized protein LOC141684205 isoform X2 n=1 Tax=Apium graveolens TaxID=4045 RepID=UPI003D7BC302
MDDFNLGGGKKGGDLDGGVRKKLDFDGGGGERSGFDGGFGERLDFDGGFRERLDFDGGFLERLDFDGGVGERLDFEGGVRERLDFDALNFGSVSGEKRDVDETGGGFDGGVCERLDFDALNLGSVSGEKRGVDETGGDLDGGVCGRLDFDASGSGSLRGKEKGVNETEGDLDGGVCGRIEKGIDEIWGAIDGKFRKFMDSISDFNASNLDSLSGKKKGVDEIGGDFSGICEGLDFNEGVCGKLDFETPNLCDLSGRKRGIDEIGGDFDGGVCGKRRVGVVDINDGGLRAGKGVVEEGNEVENLFSGDFEMGRIKVDGVMGLEKAGERFCDIEGKKEMSFDLNLSVSGGAKLVGSSVGGGESVRVIDRECVEVFNISSDEEEEQVVGRDYKGKGKLIETESSFNSIEGLDLYFKKNNEFNQAASGSMDGIGRCTREEKGKEIDVQPWMPLGGDSTDFDLFYSLEHLMDPFPEFDMQLPEIFQQNEVGLGDLDRFNSQQHIELEQQSRELDLIIEQNLREIKQRGEELTRIAEELRQREIEDRKRVHRRFARPLEEDGQRGSSENENMHREQKSRRSDQPLIKWKPSENRENNVAKRFVPSLLDLSLNVLANNADMIVSLEGVPCLLKQRLSNLLCDSRKINIRVLDLFIKDSPEEIRIKDASWITEHQFKMSFRSFGPKNLKVFQFDLGGQCVCDDTIAEILMRSRSSLPGLGIISLRGACRLSDEALKVIVKLAPALCSINLGECSLLTHVGINYIADALGNSLRELFIDNCCRIDARDMASAVKKFKHLEVLSVAGIPNLCDRVISDILTACGRNIKDLDLADCERLTDSSFKIIGQNCSDLRTLNIVNLHNLTDVGLSYLADGCKSIRILKLGRNKFSDEAIADFIEIAGRSLEELSLNHVRQRWLEMVLLLQCFLRCYEHEFLFY